MSTIRQALEKRKSPCATCVHRNEPGFGKTCLDCINSKEGLVNYQKAEDDRSAEVAA